jgi:hypothetical protein
MRRKIGVSVISLLPWSIISLPLAVGIAGSAGFSGIQLLPLRGMNGKNIWEISDNFVISIENAWNSGTLSGTLKRLFRLSGEKNPTLKDWLFFGETPDVKRRMGIIKDRFPDALYVVHSAGRGIVEIHPELRLRDIDYARIGIDVVLDTEHWIRGGRHGEPPVTTDWRRFLQILNPNQIKLIHFKPGYPSAQEARAILLELAKITNCPVILEARPPLVHLVKWNISEKMVWLMEHYNFMNKILQD